MKSIAEKVQGYDFDSIKEKLNTTETTKENPIAKEDPAAKEKLPIKNVKGSMTISEAADSLKIDLAEFYKLFKIPKEVPPETTMNTIGDTIDGYDFHSIKSSLE